MAKRLLSFQCLKFSKQGRTAHQSECKKFAWLILFPLASFPCLLTEDSSIAVLIKEQQSYMILPPPSKNHFLVKNLYIIVVAERGFGADSRECAATQHLCLRWAFALLGLVIVSGTEPFFVCALLVNGFVGRLLGKLRLWEPVFEVIKSKDFSSCLFCCPRIFSLEQKLPIEVSSAFKNDISGQHSCTCAARVLLCRAVFGQLRMRQQLE